MLVVYKSKAKSTKIIAQNIAKTINAVCINKIKKEPKNHIIFYGFWFDKSKPCNGIYKDIRYLKNKNIALFFTLGSKNLEYQERLKNDFLKLFSNIANVISIECFKVAIPSELIQKKLRKAKKNPKKYKPSKEQIQRYKESLVFPNESKLKKSSDFALKVIENA